MTNDDYIFTRISEQAELSRLQLQERTVDWLSQGRLLSLGLGRDCHCLEAGVGAGSMLRWMASQVGPTGKVTGIDLDDRFFPASKEAHITLTKGDLRTAEIEEEAFDFIHARLLFLHLPPEDRGPLLTRFLSALKQGGWLLVLDAAYGFPIKEPGNRGEELMAKLLAAIASATYPNADFKIGEQIPGLLTSAGFANIEATGHFPILMPGGLSHSYAYNVIDTYQILTSKLFPDDTGPISTSELDELRDQLSTTSAITGWPITLTWGQRPTEQ